MTSVETIIHRPHSAESSMIFMSDIEVMSCESVLKVEDLKHGQHEYDLEPKYDGFRLIAGMFDEPRSFTRTMKSQDGKLPYIYDRLREFPSGTVFDGEICSLVKHDDGTVDNNFEHVQSIMLSKPERARRVAEETRPLDFVVFDILFFDGIDLRDWPLESRRELLEYELWSRLGDDERMGMTPISSCTQENHDLLCSMGFEGSVVKLKDSKYRNGRSTGWVKLKRQVDIDAVIVGYTEGDGKYKGMIGSIVFAQPKSLNPSISTSFDGGLELPGNWVIRGSCSGMTDEIRQEITSRKHELLGTIVTVTHFGVMRDKVHLRHPNFVRFRPDKRIKDCTWHDH